MKKAGYPGLWIHGAPGAIRTRGTGFRRAVLCPLSYGGVKTWLFYHACMLRRMSVASSLRAKLFDERA